VIVMVDICVGFLGPPQPPEESSAKPNRIAATPLKRWRYLRVPASSQKQKPKSRNTREAGRAPASGCALAAAELEKLTAVLIAAPAGATVAGLKLHATPDGSQEQLKLTEPVKALMGVTVSVADAGVALVSVPLVGLIASESRRKLSTRICEAGYN